MNAMQMSSLRDNLSKYSLELSDTNDIELKNAVSVILLELDKSLKTSVKKNNEIFDILSFIEKRDIRSLNERYPRIKYNDIEKMIEGNRISENLESYTILQLKIIYYLYTGDKDNNAIKTRDKKTVLNAVNEVLLEVQRSNALKNIKNK